MIFQDDLRPASALDNVDQRLRSFWHPVGVASNPAPRCVRLLGEDIQVDHAAGLEQHLGLWWLAPEAPIAPLPEVPEASDPAFVEVHSPCETWRAGAAQLADNFLDISHIPYLHRGTFADPSDREIPRLRPVLSDHGFAVTHRHRTQKLHTDGLGRREMYLWFTAPFCVMMRLSYLDDDAIITAAFFAQPVDAEHTTLYAVNWRNDILDGRCTPAETIDLQQRVAAEDRSMLEQLPVNWVPLDLRCEVHTLADATTIEMRRTLARILVEPRR